MTLCLCVCLFVCVCVIVASLRRYILPDSVHFLTSVTRQGVLLEIKIHHKYCLSVKNSFMCTSQRVVFISTPIIISQKCLHVHQRTFIAKCTCNLVVTGTIHQRPVESHFVIKHQEFHVRYETASPVTQR